MPQLPRRADHVGSLLRPAALAEVRQAWKDGRLPADDLRAVEDDMIRELAAKEEAVGLAAVTDGEFRRDWWHLDFLHGFAGIDLAQRPRPANFSGEGESPPIPVITGKVRHEQPIFVDAFSFLASVTTKTAKITIPGPGMASFMGGRAVI